MSTDRKPRVFISRTTAGFSVLAEQVADIPRQRGIKPIIQTGFCPPTHNIKGMLAEQPVHGLNDPRAKDGRNTYGNIGEDRRPRLSTDRCLPALVGSHLKAGKPQAIDGRETPSSALGSLFKGRDVFSPNCARTSLPKASFHQGRAVIVARLSKGKA